VEKGDFLSQMTFGQRLKALRIARGMTSKNLAATLKISLPYYSQVEADLAIPSESLAREIAKYFGEDEEELVFLARRVPKQIDDLLEKFPNQTQNYFRRVNKRNK
jgi:transcriptional regulator with XRE-family HTH domain